jgi:hypothetical protein
MTVNSFNDGLLLALTLQSTIIPSPARFSCFFISTVALQVCSPTSRCYVSTERQFGCVPKRPPYAPFQVEGAPRDAQVVLSWNSPRDMGGINVDHYVVSIAKFEVGVDVVFQALPPTTTNLTKVDVLGLNNFIPYYFRVSAVNTLGMGPFSEKSSSIQPWVFRPGQPLNGRGASGHKRVWLKWDPPTTDGGRRITEYELWISNSTGLGSSPAVWWRLELAPVANVTIQQTALYPIRETRRRRNRKIPDKPRTALMQTVAEGQRRTELEDPIKMLSFLVSADVDLKPLTKQMYSFRVRSKNSYDFSLWSGTVKIKPTGEPPAPPTKLRAMCHAIGQPVECSAGITNDKRIDLLWSPPTDDGGSPITGYIIMYGEYDRVMANQLNLDKWLTMAIRSDSPSMPGDMSGPITTYNLQSSLVNDIDWIVSIQAINAFGIGPRVLSGRLTPKLCEVEDGVSCNACTQPYFILWNGCIPPACVTSSSPDYSESTHSRLRDCVQSQGCRLEVFYGTPDLGQWGAVSIRSFTQVTGTRPLLRAYDHFEKILSQVTSLFTSLVPFPFTQTSSEIACRTFGLRSRPEICGSGTCGGSFPSAVQGTGVIWLEGVACTGVEWRIHDCPAGMRNRVDVITGTYGFTKWGGAQEDMPRDPDVGICCWFSPRPPIRPFTTFNLLQASTPSQHKSLTRGNLLCVVE